MDSTHFKRMFVAVRLTDKRETRRLAFAYISPFAAYKPNTLTIDATQKLSERLNANGSACAA